VCIYSTLATCVLLYVVVFQLLLEHRYARFETPVGYTNLWPGISSPWPAGRADRPTDAELPSFCNNPEYDWGVNHSAEERVITGGFMTQGASCRGFSSQTDVEISSSTFTAVTLETTSFLDRFGNTTSTRFAFTANPEGAVPNVIHIYSVESSQRPRQNVRTEILDAAGTVLRSFPDGDIITGVTVGEWMSFAGLSVDAVNPQGQLLSLPHPRYRHTGAVILVRMKYTNLRRWAPPFYDPLCTVTVEALPNAWGFMGSRVEPAHERDGGVGRASVLRTGIRLQFLQSGTIGELDVFQIVLRLIEGTVLFNLARFLTDAIAELPCCLGRRFVRATTDEVETKGELTPGCFCRCCPEPEQLRGRCGIPGACVCGVVRAKGGGAIDAPVEPTPPPKAASSHADGPTKPEHPDAEAPRGSLVCCALSGAEVPDGCCACSLWSMSRRASRHIRCDPDRRVHAVG